jgi:uncharacterized protein
MRIEASVQAIRVLVKLAELDAEQHGAGAADGRRGAISGRVTGRLRDRYEALLEAGRVPALVPIERGTCSGCNLRLPTMLESLVRRAPAVHTCPHCARMMYLPALLAERAAERPQPASPTRRARPRAARAGAAPHGGE